MLKITLIAAAAAAVGLPAAAQSASNGGSLPTGSAAQSQGKSGSDARPAGMTHYSPGQLAANVRGSSTSGGAHGTWVQPQAQGGGATSPPPYSGGAHQAPLMPLSTGSGAHPVGR